MVRTYLVETAGAELTSLRASEITSDLDSSPTSVVQHLNQLQKDIAGMSLEQSGPVEELTMPCRGD
jgi:hypothetical protein